MSRVESGVAAGDESAIKHPPYAWWRLRFDLSWRVWSVWRRNVQVWQRYWLSNLGSHFVEPFIYLLGIGLGLGYYIEGIEGVPYVAFVAPGIIASSAMWGGAFECSYGTFIRMTYQKTHDAIMATPVSLDEICLGEILFAATKSAVYGAIILVVIALFGLVPAVGWAVIWVPFVAFLLGLVFAGLAMAVAAVAPHIEGINYFITMFMTPLFIFSGIFFPLTVLPPWAATVAWFTPLLHGVNLMRDLVLWNRGALADALWLAVVALLLAPAAIMLMRRKLVH